MPTLSRTAPDGAFLSHDDVASLVAQAAFHAFVVVCLLRYMLRDDIMTRDELFAAAGLYVLMAFVFAYLYALIEHWQPGAFVINAANNPQGVTRWWDLLYFSFTCLTSVGFGEITPATRPCSLAGYDSADGRGALLRPSGLAIGHAATRRAAGTRDRDNRTPS